MSYKHELSGGSEGGEATSGNAWETMAAQAEEERKARENGATGAERNERKGSGYEDYFLDRRAENMEALSGRPKLQKLYERMAEQHGFIKHVELIDDEALEENAYFSSIDADHFKETGEAVSAVRFNVAHNFEHKEEQEPGTMLFIKKVALQLGADWKEIEQNREAFDAFVLMHEFGHAADFISTYYTPLATEGERDLGEIVLEAAKESSDDYKRGKKGLMSERPSIEAMREKKLLATNEDPNDSDPERRAKVREKVIKRLNNLRNTQYRQMPKEARADAFAREMMKQNADLFFRPSGEADDGRGLIEMGKSVDLDLEDWREVVGLHSGTPLRTMRMMDDGQGRIVPKLNEGKRDVIEGVYAPMLVNEPGLEISRDGDPNSLRLSRPLDDIARVQAKRGESGELRYLLTDGDGRMFMMEVGQAPGAQ